MSILEKLKEERVVDFYIHKGQLFVTEQCDEEFETTLSIEELDMLINELYDLRTELAKKIKT